MHSLLGNKVTKKILLTKYDEYFGKLSVLKP